MELVVNYPNGYSESFDVPEKYIEMASSMTDEEKRQIYVYLLNLMEIILEYR